jgi:hypothetical protein
MLEAESNNFNLGVANAHLQINTANPVAGPGKLLSLRQSLV